MSQVIWCDYGNHAAKRDDGVIAMVKQSKQIVITDQFGQHLGNVPPEQVDICGECAVVAGLTNDITVESPSERHASITKGERK
jgi:hypothetical protein